MLTQPRGGREGLATPPAQVRLFPGVGALVVVQGSGRAEPLRAVQTGEGHLSAMLPHVDLMVEGITYLLTKSILFVKYIKLFMYNLSLP